MLGQLPEINRAVAGIGFMVGSQRPFVQFLVKNWPLALIAGFAVYARGRERWKKNELSTYNVMADVGMIISPLVGLALLNQLAREEQQIAAANSAAVVPPIPLMTAAPHPSQAGA